MVVTPKRILFQLGWMLLSQCCFGCHSKHKDYSYILKLAPANQIELKKLIAFYNKEENPDKIDFAEFLIENLPNQYTLRYSIINKKNGADIVLKRPISVDSIEFLRDIPGNTLQIDTIYTIKYVSSDFIISQINYAADLRRNHKWAKEITKDQFCNFILPYQINNEERFDYKRFYGNRYLPYISDVLVKDLDTNAVLGNYIPPFFETLRNPLSCHVDFTSILQIKALQDGSDHYPDIEDIKILETHALRAIGVPCAYEYTPFVAPLMRGDVIVNVFDTGNKTYFANLSRNVYKSRVAKFYRNIFDPKRARNPFREIMDMGIKSNDIPFTLNIPKSIDITREKTLTADVQFRVPDSLLSNRVLYIATGLNNNWKIVSWGIVNKSNKTVSFNEMGVNMHYSLSTFKNGKISLIGSPIILTSSKRE